MADHAVAVELFYDGDWQSAPTYVRNGITLKRGATGEGQESPPGSATAQVANKSGTYNPRNPVSPLYGLAGRNTPMRVSADGGVRATVEASSWAPRRSLDCNGAWTDIEGGGILQRLQQGDTPLRSPLYRAVLAADVQPSYWWDLETGDGRATVSVPSTLAGGPSLIAAPASAGSSDHRISGVVGGSVVGPPGAGGAVDLSGGGQLSTTEMFTSAAGPFRFEVGVMFAEPVGEFDSGQILRIKMLDTIVGLFAQATAGFELVLDVSDNDTFDSGTASVILDDGAWHHIRLDLTYAGVNTDYELTVDGVTVLSGTIAGVTIYQVDELVLSPTGDVGAASHLLFWDQAVPTNVDTYEAFTGHAGELAGQRFLRLGEEEGINCIVVGDEDDTQPMGPQSVATLPNLLRECVQTDDGLLFEPRDEIGLVFRTGRDRYNQDPVLELDFTAGGIGPPLAPVLDDLNTRNDVTAARPGGGTARAVRETGPLNVQNPIDDPQGVGRYDTRVEVNAATDEALPSHAAWHLHKGTVDEPRYPQVRVDLDGPRSAALISAVDSVDVGDRITIANLPTDWHQGDPASLLVVGITENYPPGAGDFRRIVTFNTVPASPYEIGIVGEDDGSSDLRGQVVDTDLSSLASGINSVTTTLSVASTGGVLWTTDSDHWNPALNGGGMFIVIGGEEMRVTNITGASSPQTFTVVRSTNGVVKSHSSGAAVHARHPVVVGH